MTSVQQEVTDMWKKAGKKYNQAATKQISATVRLGIKKQNLEFGGSTTNSADKNEGHAWRKNPGNNLSTEQWAVNQQLSQVLTFIQTFMF